MVAGRIQISMAGAAPQIRPKRPVPAVVSPDLHANNLNLQVEAILNQIAVYSDMALRFRGTQNETAVNNYVKELSRQLEELLPDPVSRASAAGLVEAMARPSNASSFSDGSQYFGSRRSSAVTGSQSSTDVPFSLTPLRQPLSQRGMTLPQILDQLPVVSYNCSEKEECLICLNQFKKTEEVRILWCFHKFHKGCVDKWIAKSSVCPTCMAVI